MFLTAGLWAFVAAAHVLLYVKLPMPMSSRFAIVNLFGIGLFFGPQAAGLLAVLALALWLVLWPTARLRQAGRERLASGLGLISLLLLVSLFVGYKLYFDRALRLGPTQEGHPATLGFVYGVLRVVSFSYVFLRAVDLIRSVAWGVERLLNPIALTGYLGPFHMLIAVPISPYAEHVKADEIPRPEPRFAHLLNSVNTIATGLFFKVVIAQAMKIFLFGVDGALVSKSWIDTAYLLTYLFFDFAGYSLIALGIGRLLHVPTPLNFDHPYLACSVTDFWQRWHKSLGVFVRNNLFLPLQLFLARRVRRRSLTSLVAIVPLAVAFVFVAMWHRLTVPFLIWGIAMAIIMVIEKLVRDQFLYVGWFQHQRAQTAIRVVGPFYALCVIITSIHYITSEIFTG